MNKEIANLIVQIARIRNVDVTYVCETLRASIVAGLRRRYGPDTEADAEINSETGEIRVFLAKNVVERVASTAREISASDARKISPSAQPGDMIRVEVPLDELGRIAIRKASDELVVKLREAERTKLYDEFCKKKGEIVTGTVQKIGRDEIIVNLGLIEAALPNHEQLKADHYRQGLPIKAYVHRVEKTPIGPRVFLSRTHPEFLRKLMSREIPEIREAVVEIKGIARSPGFRSKVAVTSLDEKVDPVGACVGYRKSRIENIIKELSGEKVDIVQWSKDPQIFIARALGPAKVSEVIKEGDTHIVVVPDAEFSIAIGKKGQNVWLASLLCGVKIEVLKETDYRNRIIMSKASTIPLTKLGLEEALLGKLTAAGMNTAFDALNSTPEDLARVTELAPEAVEPLKQQVRDATWRVVEGKPVFTPPPQAAAPSPAPETPSEPAATPEPAAPPEPTPAAESSVAEEPAETPARTEQS
ncbi:transcription termination factor NusA [candidate division WOR-3 bacterium]|nr:transcription termination factor NusA [candidate division WOR-3 bacterium]